MHEATGLGSNREPIYGFDQTRIDDKGRLVIAKPMREWLDGSFTVVLGEVSGLSIYPTDEWDALRRWVVGVPKNHYGRQQFTLLVLGNSASGLICDQQGRVVIPLSLRELAGIDSEVVVVGNEDHLEVWDREEYSKFVKNPSSIKGERRAATRESREMVEGWYVSNTVRS